MARVACMVMLKNERELTPRFLAYHAALFGAENLYVFDNGSTDPQVQTDLRRFEALGVHVERGLSTIEDFHRKGTILGDLIKRLERETDYDFYLPLDCDEFLVLRTGQGYTADPALIHAYLDRLRGERRILHVTLNLANLAGVPDRFRPAEYSKTVYPRGVFLHMDHGYHTGVAVGGDSPYLPCGLVYAHFHYRPYDEVVAFAKQKLRVELSDAEIEDHERLRGFRGLGWHMVEYIVGGAEAYYGQFRDIEGTVVFPELAARFAAIGLDAPFNTFRLPPPASAQAVAPPHLVIDEANRTRVRGWALDPDNPHTPLQLRFLIDGAQAWEGACDAARPDVRAAGHPSERVGFDFRPETGSAGPHVLTVTDRRGGGLRMLAGGQARLALPLAAPIKPAQPAAIYSHIDSFRRGWVQGWALRTVITPEGPRLLGRCTVALTHERRVVMQVIADMVRGDVATALQGEPHCGFLIEIPRALLTRGRSPVFRLFVMPERQELTGSPCIVAPLAAYANA